MKTLISSLCLFIAAAALHASEVGLRIRFGLTDNGNTKWDGTVTVAPGKVVSIDGWRFQMKDEVQGTTGWKAETRPTTQRRSNNAKKTGKGKAKGAGGLMADNGVILVLEGVTEASVVSVKTAQGDFDFKLADVPYGKVIEKLGGGVDVERVAASRPLTKQRSDDDFPAVAVSKDGSTHVAYVSFTPGLDRDERAKSWNEAPADLKFLAKPPGADQLFLRSQKDGKWSEPLAVTPSGQDIYKCAVAVDGKGRVWIFWSENVSYPETAMANFEIKGRSLENGKLSDVVQLSKDAGSDICPVATTDSNGNVWVAWQGARGNVFRVMERHQTSGGKWSEETRVSTQSFNCWSPAIAASKSGRVAIGWDTYDKGDYDVWLREFAASGKPDAARAVAQSAGYEARPAMTYDQDGRLWVSYELSGPTWGKDWGALVKDEGIGLYRDRQIGLSILSEGKWMQPEASFAQSLPGAKKRRGPANLPVRRPEQDVTRKKGEEAETAASTYNNLARIACDKDNRIWLFCRSREGTFHTPLGSVWIDYVTYYDGNQWIGPTILPHSDNLLYNQPAVAPHPNGGLVVAHSTDHRQDRHVTGRGANNASLDSDKDPFDNDIFVSRIEFPTATVKPSLKEAKGPANTAAKASEETVKERKEIEGARAFRSDYNGTQLRVVRGEFHRHTEISGDGGNDGPLEDSWRYAIDVAGMDWLGVADHDNGGGREYTWWLTQKTADAFRLPGRFDPPFTYERSVSYPEGHRNVVFAQRGVRTLPRLPKSDRNVFAKAPDTQMLYKYLHLFDGVCASHTSATNMGTDWRDNDPVVEPMVEIYQGCRQNYERPGAPRCPTADDAIGGWEPLGFVNLALQKGYRFSFQASSDHSSTHISYAMVYAEGTSREDLLKAMRLRHTYGATDNIIAEYRCKANGKDYMLGDEFSTKEHPELRLKLKGTAPFARVTLVKDDKEIKVWEPGTADVNLTWTDENPTPGKASYYYFRGEQALQNGESIGELVWVSPMWITYTGK